MRLFVWVIGAIAWTLTPQSAFSAERTSIRFLFPRAPYSGNSDQEVTALVEEYNRRTPGAQIELILKGENFSSLKELVAFHLAGDPPEIAAVQTSEILAVRKMKLARTVRIDGLGSLEAIPFRKTAPILLADQEMLFRVRANPDLLPKTWEGLAKLAESLAGPAANDPKWHSLALPIQGPMGLFVFEGLIGHPLWKRDSGGLKIPDSLRGEIRALQKLIDTPGVGAIEETWERAIQSFLDRKSPLLITSLDVLPFISQQATFRWTAAPIPTLHAESPPLVGGSSLIVTRDSPEVIRFLNFFYSRASQKRWLESGGFLPITPGSLPSSPALRRISSSFKSLRSRTTDTEIVRAHSEWIQALRLMLGEPSRRIAPEGVVQQLDRNLNRP